MATATATPAAQKVGKVVQIIGPVVDVEFEGGHLPEIFNAVRIVSDAGDAEKVDVISEVEQHLGENRVRTVAMKPTDGLRRGMRVIDTGAPISMPVGPATLGRVMNVLGEPVDFPDRPIAAKDHWSIHRHAPTLEDQSTETQMFETGIEIGAPVSITRIPRRRPSVGFIATVRTRFSPRCCSTSEMTSTASSPASETMRTALKISGRCPPSNSTSTTGPIIWTILPTFCAVAVAVAIVFSAGSDAPVYRASAPDTTSIISRVMAAWRTLFMYSVS